MTYALGLYFDRASEDKLYTLIRRIAQSGVNPYMLEKKIPPHLTLASVCAEHCQPLAGLLDARISDFQAGDVIWASLGAFVPRVLFAAPVLDQYLTRMNLQMNGLAELAGTAGDNGRYLPTDGSRIRRWRCK